MSLKFSFNSYCKSKNNQKDVKCVYNKKENENNPKMRIKTQKNKM